VFGVWGGGWVVGWFFFLRPPPPPPPSPNSPAYPRERNRYSENAGALSVIKGSAVESNTDDDDTGYMDTPGYSAAAEDPCVLLLLVNTTQT
jgi:hypothetical protein